MVKEGQPKKSSTMFRKVIFVVLLTEMISYQSSIRS